MILAEYFDWLIFYIFDRACLTRTRVGRTHPPTHKKAACGARIGFAALPARACATGKIGGRGDYY